MAVAWLAVHTWRKRVGVEPTGDGQTRRPPVLKLSRFAGVSEAGAPGTRGFRVTGWGAGARRRNPERSRGNSSWRKRVGVEPTGDGQTRRPPVLKTGTITGPHALPRNNKSKATDCYIRGLLRFANLSRQGLKPHGFYIGIFGTAEAVPFTNLLCG